MFSGATKYDVAGIRKQPGCASVYCISAATMTRMTIRHCAGNASMVAFDGITLRIRRAI